MKESKDFSKIEKAIGVIFKNQDLLRQAFVHRSYLNEHRDFPMAHNERLEFLGDAVMELIVTEHLYENYQSPEGELTNWRSALVRGDTISKLARELGYNDYLFLSRGESKAEGRSRDLILANCFEAVVGAMYLDAGYNTCREFLRRVLIAHLTRIINEQSYIDPKSKLQELIQEKLNYTPEYKVLSEGGPDHDKHFVVGVFIEKRQIGEGEGPSKQRAQEQAAAAALREHVWDKND